MQAVRGEDQWAGVEGQAALGRSRVMPEHHVRHRLAGRGAGAEGRRPARVRELGGSGKLQGVEPGLRGRIQHLRLTDHSCDARLSRGLFGDHAARPASDPRLQEGRIGRETGHLGAQPPAARRQGEHRSAPRAQPAGETLHVVGAEDQLARRHRCAAVGGKARRPVLDPQGPGQVQHPAFDGPYRPHGLGLALGRDEALGDLQMADVGVHGRQAAALDLEAKRAAARAQDRGPCPAADLQGSAAVRAQPQGLRQGEPRRATRQLDRHGRRGNLKTLRGALHGDELRRVSRRDRSQARPAAMAVEADRHRRLHAVAAVAYRPPRLGQQLRHAKLPGRAVL